MPLRTAIFNETAAVKDFFNFIVFFTVDDVRWRYFRTSATMDRVYGGWEEFDNAKDWVDSCHGGWKFETICV